MLYDSIYIKLNPRPTNLVILARIVVFIFYQEEWLGNCKEVASTGLGRLCSFLWVAG